MWQHAVVRGGQNHGMSRLRYLGSSTLPMLPGGRERRDQEGPAISVVTEPFRRSPASGWRVTQA